MAPLIDAPVLALGEIKMRDWWKIAVREFGMGLVLGLILSVIAVGRVLMYPDQHIQFALRLCTINTGRKLSKYVEPQSIAILDSS